MQGNLRVIAAVLAMITLGACYRGHRAKEVDDDDGGPRAQRVRVVDADGGALGSFRLRRRSAVAQDERGVTIGRASRLPDRVVVRSRNGEIVFVFRSIEGAFVVEDGAGQERGRLEVAPERVILAGSDGYQQGEVVISEGEDVYAEVFGAAGTDLLFRVVSGERDLVSVTDADGQVRSRWQGRDVTPQLVGPTLLEAPSFQPESDRLFQAGLILLLRDRNE